MKRRTRMLTEELNFVRKYCLGGTFPASDERCPYMKAKILPGSRKSPTGGGDSEEADAMFLCRYPDEKMPTHEARLISILKRCPNDGRRNSINTPVV